MLYPRVKEPSRWRRAYGRITNGRKNVNSLEAAIPSLVPDATFRAEIRREVLRSDRTSLPLTLVVFGVATAEGAGRSSDADALWHLACIVADCMRETDSGGWYRDDLAVRIGLLLHHTKPERARRIINTVRRRFQMIEERESAVRRNPRSVTYEIFAYPRAFDAGLDDSNHSSNGVGRSGASMDSSVDTSGDTTAPSGNGRLDGNHASPITNRTRTYPPSPEALISAPLPRWKRVMDIAGAGVGLILLSPVFLIIALLIKLTSPGPAIFRQIRIGRFGKPFVFLKFRTMPVNSDSSEHEKYVRSLIDSRSEDKSTDSSMPMEKLDNADPSITPIGRWLRKTYLDELPQLINVLRGNMTLVGPRPCLPYEAEQYLLWHARRFDSRPGMTGLWQVMGKNRRTFKEMIRLDIVYSRKRSLWLDIKILFMTAPAILSELRESLANKGGLHVDSVQNT